MLTKVCIKVGVVDYEFHDSYFVSLKLKKSCIVCGTNSTMIIVIKLILMQEFFMEKLNLQFISGIIILNSDFNN
jgi:hypothetical protein